MRDLFGEKPEPKSNPAKRLVMEYKSAFVELFGFQPKIAWNRDMRNVGELIKLWGEDETRKILQRVLVSRNRRIQNSDRSILLAYDMAQQLKMEVDEPADKSLARTRHNVDAIRSALGVKQ